MALMPTIMQVSDRTRGTALARVLALALASAGASAGAGAGAGVAQAAAPATGVPGLGYEAITPDLGIRDLSPNSSGIDGSAADVTGQSAKAETAPNPYAVNTYDSDVTFNQGLPTNTPQRILPGAAAGRYYGAAYSGGDLTSAYTAGEEVTTTARGKTGMKARRLGVFDQEVTQKRRLSIKPYIEATQVVTGYISPTSDVVTYSVLAAGADMTINGRNNQGVISARAEQRLGESRRDFGSSVTGIARLSSSLVPDTLRVDYGAYANRTNLTAGGTLTGAAGTRGDTLTHVYSVYGGPTFSKELGDVAVTSHYHAGYTQVDGNTTLATTTGTIRSDALAHSTVQDARIAVGTRAGEALPVGVGVDAGIYREDVSNLDQRVVDRHVRGEVSVPVSDSTSLVGGIGYEKVDVTSRDAVRDATGAPVYDGQGRMVTNYAAPRYVAFETEGLIWDAGVVWRPSRRTNLEAHIGQRYGELGGYGFFIYQPSSRTNIYIVAYEGITGFGGSLTNSLFNLPTQFVVLRDAITGNLSSCGASSQGSSCTAGSIGSVNSTIYRGRGLSATLGYDTGRWRTGFGAGYDRRQYLTSAETVLAGANGKVDEYYWIAAYAGARLSDHALVDATIDAYKFHSGLNSAGTLNAMRAVAVYQRMFSNHFSANATMALDGIFRPTLDDLWTGSGSVGVRYTF